jgi:hypothetical protein
MNALSLRERRYRIYNSETHVETGIPSSSDLPEGADGSGIHFGWIIRRFGGQALFQGHTERDQWIPRIIRVDPAFDFREPVTPPLQREWRSRSVRPPGGRDPPFVFLADVIAFREIDQVRNRLCGEQLQCINMLDLRIYIEGTREGRTNATNVPPCCSNRLFAHLCFGS